MSRKARWIALAAVGVAAVALVAWILWPTPQTANARTAEANGVTVTATLLDGDGVRFLVVLDTHTVDLAPYDVVANSRLVVDGAELTAQGSSEAKDNTGHHVEAELRFDAPRGHRMDLVLRDLGGVPERRLVFG